MLKELLITVIVPPLHITVAVPKYDVCKLPETDPRITKAWSQQPFKKDQLIPIELRRLVNLHPAKFDQELDFGEP